MTSQIPCLRCRATAIADEQAQAVSCPSCGLALPPPQAAAWMASRDGGQPFGPYTIAQLAAYVASGQVLPTDNLWHQGAPGWVPAGQLAALAPGGAAAPAMQPQGAPAFQPGQQPQMGGAYGQPYVQQPHGGGMYGGPGMVYGSGSSSAANLGLHFKRAFKWNLRTMPVQPDEEQQLLATSVDEVNARRYLVWRRSVLLAVSIPLLIAAVLGVIGSFTGMGWGVFSGVGILVEIIRLAILFLLPVVAWMAAQSWNRHRQSRKVLLIGWMIGFLLPLLLALIPASALYRADPTVDRNAFAQGMGFVGAILAFATLMPSVLSLIPGVLRGCLRIKALLPQSLLPGLFLIAATPLYVLLFLVIFTTVNQLIGNILLILAVLALASSPLVYLFNAGLFTRPLRTEEEFRKVGTVQNTATIIFLVGVVLLLIYLFTASFLGKSLVGFSSQTSVMQPWNAHFLQLPIEYFFRSLLTTVVVADLFMLMNLTLWRQSKSFEGTEESRHYDRIMSEIEEAGGAGLVPGNTIYRGGAPS
jgi:GYF domain 2